MAIGAFRPAVGAFIFMLLAGSVPARPAKTSGLQGIAGVDLLGPYRAGGERLIGIRFRLLPGWYLYWKNPGDAGLPPAVKWTLPAGWKAGPLHFPTPGKFVEESLVAYGYKKEVIFFAPLEAPPGEAGRPVLRAALDWLVCKQGCIRGRATVELPKRPSDAPKDEETFRRALHDLPRPLHEAEVSIRSAALSAGGENPLASVLFEGSGAARISDFFPELMEKAVIDLSSVRVSAGSLSLKFAPNSHSSLPKRLAGLAIIDGTGYEVAAIFDTKGGLIQ